MLSRLFRKIQGLITSQQNMLLQIDITNACNLTCLHCYHPHHKNDGAISVEDWVNILTQFKKFIFKLNMEPNFIICGGEPFISKNFLPILNILNHFTNGEEFAREISKIKGSEFLCLVDFELLGQSKNGLDIIEELQISKKSVLVTSRFDESEVRNRAHNIGVRFIPKSLASLIPIINATSEEYFEIVYIDDDYLLRLGWERRAIKKNITLLTLTSCEEFQSHVSKISKSKTKIYIDSSLGKGKMPGEEFATLLNDQGYEHLYIASGYEASNFAHLPWLKVAGKECPF